MDSTSQLTMFLQMFLMYLPVFIVCLVAGVIIAVRWQEGSTGSVWALLGFGLALALCFLMPIGHTLLRRWVFTGGGQVSSRMWAYTTFSIVGSVLHAVVYALLLVAIFAGRDQRSSATPPPTI